MLPVLEIRHDEMREKRDQMNKEIESSSAAIKALMSKILSKVDYQKSPSAKQI